MSGDNLYYHPGSLTPNLDVWVQFVSRPFVVGDRVELRTAGGASVVTGLVERIAPMSTTVRNDHNIPISIPNK